MMANSTTTPAPIAIFFQGFIVSVTVGERLAFLDVSTYRTIRPSRFHRSDGHVL
jgi:hypothetical protein